MKSIARFSVNYPVTVLMIVLAVVLLGSISFNKLGMDLFPDMNSPRLYVMISAGELPPEEIEQQFVENIESVAIRQKNAVKVSSICRSGGADVTVEYAWNTNMDDALLDLQKNLNSVSQNQDIDELTISQLDPNASPVLLLGLSNPNINDMDELRRIAESYLRNELIRYEGIADVRLLGQEEKEVLIQTDEYLLEAYGVTTDNIASKIEEFNRTVSGGNITEMGRNYAIKGMAQFETIEDIRNLIITYKTTTSDLGGISQPTGKAPVYLSDIATVDYINTEPNTIVRLNGTRGIALEVFKETRYNTVRTVENFFENLSHLKRALPEYDLTVIRNQGAFITDAISEVKQSALLGVFFAVLVLFVFLRRIGTTAVISIAIPISVIATFNLMYFRGLTLNIMTLGGLALGAGMLVDNAIVVMENIFRLIEEGKSITEAAVDGAGMVGGAITASTLTTVVVFLPIVYIHGSAGELFKEQAWTVAFSLISSLVVAILVIPMLTAALLRHRNIKPLVSGKVRYPVYRKLLTGFLNMRWIVAICAVIAVVVAAYLIPVVGSEFMPKTGSRALTVTLTFPEGTELHRTDDAVHSIESQVRDLLGDNLSILYSVVGSFGASDTYNTTSTLAEDNNASMYLVLSDSTNLSMDSVMNSLNNLLADIPELESQVYQEQAAVELTLGSETAPLVIDIEGEELDEIQSLTEQAVTLLSNIDDLTNIETSLSGGRPEINIVLDRTRAGMLGITMNQITSAVTSRIEGTSAGQWDASGNLRDIYIDLPRLTIADLSDITVSASGSEIPITDLATVTHGTGPKEIIRNNQGRVGRITAYIDSDRPLDHIVADITAQLDTIDFPTRYSYDIGGQEQERRDAFENLRFALILSLILVYMVLASQFESLIHPFVVLLSIPLAGVGAILTFLIIGRPLNIMAYIGIIMLAGIAVNDSIILIDAINRHRRNGFSTKEAILMAGDQRIRPIIMTSLTTILALLPLTFGFGEGAALRSPMAFAVIGGLISSTILTLVVIPCLYSIMSRGGKIAIRRQDVA